MDNYIFKGIGHAVGQYKVSNQDIYQATQMGYLKGFDESKILKSVRFKAFKEKHPEVTPFDYFTEYKMGFKNRQTVVPFPPKKKYVFKTETATDLCVRAIESAIEDANINPEYIDAWFVSTVSPHEQAPGIAATVKTYFVKTDNLSPTFTLCSGCSGFNLNLERAMEYLQNHPEARYVAVAHTETMSSFLTEKSKFVSFVTFGDGAGAIILSKEEGETKEGLLQIENAQDLKMIDYVGVDKMWNLYMSESVIKDRAIVNIVRSSRSILEKTEWKTEELDCLIPHQTGNAILHEAAKQLDVPLEKMYLEAQHQFGNVSGATVLLSWSLLHQSGQLKAGQKILSAAAGVGGKYGAFTYLMPQKKTNTPAFQYQPMKGKKLLLLGAGGLIGQHLLKQALEWGADVLAHYKDEKELAGSDYQSLNFNFTCDFEDEEQVERFIQSVKNEHQDIDYLLVASGDSTTIQSALDIASEEAERVNQINFLAPVKIYQSLFHHIKETALFIGSPVEDAQFTGLYPLVASKRSLHGFLASSSWEAFSKGTHTIYYMPGFVQGQDKYNEKQVFKFMQYVNQDQLMPLEPLTRRILKSLFLLKVRGADDAFENIMTVRRDGYAITDGRW